MTSPLPSFAGHRLKCVACRIVAHEGCLRSAAAVTSPASVMEEQPAFPAAVTATLQRCRPTFCDSVRTYREQTAIPHHWVTFNHLLHFVYVLEEFVRRTYCATQPLRFERTRSIPGSRVIMMSRPASYFPCFESQWTHPIHTNA